MKFLDAEFVQGFIRMADDGWQLGWHERNGGNLSYRVKPEEVESVKENFEAKEWQPIGTSVPKLAGEYFLVTGSGKYFRNVTIKPEDSICMVELEQRGKLPHCVGACKRRQTDVGASFTFDEPRGQEGADGWKVPCHLPRAHDKCHCAHLRTAAD